jgi:hypothetical protein
MKMEALSYTDLLKINTICKVDLNEAYFADCMIIHILNGTKFDTPHSFIIKGGMGTLISENNELRFEREIKTLTLAQKTSALSSAARGWVKSGFSMTTDEQLESRKAICKECPEWNPAGFAGTGSCNKCGCSTQAKLRMSTSKCPIDKWGPVDVRQTD